MNEEKINNAILTLETLIDCCKEDGTYYNAQKEWEALEVFKQLQNNWNELKEYIRKTKIKEFEKAFGKRYGKTFTQAEIIVCNMLIDKMQELEQGK